MGTVSRPSIVLPNTSVPCSLEQALEALSPDSGPLDPEVSEDEDEPSTLTLVSQNRQNYVSQSVKSFDPNEHLNFEQQEVVSMAGSVSLSTAGEHSSQQQLQPSSETASAAGFNTTANAGQHSIISQLLATQTSPPQQQQRQQQV